MVSTIGAAALNIADTWGNIDNPIFNTLQSVFNWTSTISNVKHYAVRFSLLHYGGIGSGLLCVGIR